jgi:hypothetical protein
MALTPDDALKGAKLTRARADKLIADGNPHALSSATAIKDTDAAAFLAARRAATIGNALRALVDTKGDVELTDDTLLDLAAMSLELAHEIETFHAIDIAEDWEREKAEADGQSGKGAH